ncbi:MAG TPA: dTDP-glucose 4,6-dehydratase [Candidatus Nanoarchaeia archaeon]|nr:dTDP-glucose 4,6-dehydratase [Candidatus Nanoarchaeia archaeon]
MRMLITGGLGFIGSHFIRHILSKYPSVQVVNLDKQTYAGNPDNLKDVEDDARYDFVKGDICDSGVVERLAKDSDIIVNFAAESHVDRSIGKPDEFIRTDIFGTFTLLEAARKFKVKRFVQISTDEVYGSIQKGSFKETDMLNPSSPYSASKAGADMLAHSYFVTYKLPVIITRSSNNYGAFQYPEKLMPLFITNAIEDKELPLYGDGSNVRDWLYVEDNCSAISLVMEKGIPGEIYNVASGQEKTNKEVTLKILKLAGKPVSLVKLVKDRPGHDLRYSLDTTKIRKLGFKPKVDFDEGLQRTVNWYKANRWWWKRIKSGEYLEYYRKQYNM